MAEKIIDPFINVENVDPDPTIDEPLTSSGQSQNLFGVININNNRIKLDGNNGRIIINDGTNDRVLIGFQEDGF